MLSKYFFSYYFWFSRCCCSRINFIFSCFCCRIIFCFCFISNFLGCFGCCNYFSFRQYYI
uniref:Candidate secreted effector n=1 Tax=Meloidogyne incognita TaxID=6306 RepID=A0A914N6C0_MELIC